MFTAFAASRLALFAVGLLAQIFIEPYSSQISPLHVTDSAALRIWGQWDTGWYLTLAEHGYMAHPDPSSGQANWAFFPAFPFISARLAHLVHLPVYGAMLILSNLSFLGGLLLTHRLARAEFDQRTADLAVALICAAPGSYVFSSAYTEALFLFAVAGCLTCVKARRWLAAGGFAALATLTRNLGVMLVAPLVIEAAPRLWALRCGPRGKFLREAARVTGGLALPALALASFCVLLWRACGDPLAFITAEKAWGRTVGNPLTFAFGPLLRRGTPIDSNLINLAACWLALGMVATLALMRRWSWFALAALLTLTPLSTGLASYARYCLVVIPLFLAGARLLATRPAAAFGVLTAFATLNGFLTVAWVLGLWVTT